MLDSPAPPTDSPPADDTRPTITGPALRAHLEFVSRLSGPSGLFVQGWVSAAELPAARLSGARGSAEVSAAWTLRHARADVSAFLGRPAEERFAFLAFYPLDDLLLRPDTLTLSFEEDGQTFSASHGIEIGAGDIARSAVRSVWPQLSADAASRFPEQLPIELMAMLADHPDTVEDLIRVHVDQAADLGEGEFILDGWCLELSPHAVRMLVVDGLTGGSAELDAHWSRTERGDLAGLVAQLGLYGSDAGFVARANLSVDVLTPARPRRGEAHPLTLFLIAEDGRLAQSSISAVPVHQLPDAARAVLGTFRSGQSVAWEVLDRQAGPALMQAYERLLPPLRIRYERSYGPTPAQPRVGIVVPVYGSLDLLRIQMARMAMDPSLREGVELLYVVDDPDLSESAASLAAELYEVFALPFRVLALGISLGYARALELGMERCSAPLLLMLDNDVLPDRHGWLDRLAKHLEQDPTLGAVGPKLLREDGTIDSMGLHVAQHPRQPQLQRVVASGRGRPDTPGGGQLSEVQALSGACLLTRRSSFRGIGGYAGQYLYGHHEDYLYCTRLRNEGLRVALDSGVQLFHLGGHAHTLLKQREPWLSDPEWQAKVNLFNLWRHARERAALTPASA